MALTAKDLKEIITEAVTNGEIDQALILADNLNDLQEAQQEEETDDSN